MSALAVVVRERRGDEAGLPGRGRVADVDDVCAAALAIRVVPGVQVGVALVDRHVCDLPFQDLAELTGRLQAADDLEVLLLGRQVARGRTVMARGWRWGTCRAGAAVRQVEPGNSHASLVLRGWRD